MNIHVLMAQRVCQYEGQYGPECLAVASEYDYYDNPEYLDGERETAEKSKEFSAVKEILLQVDDAAIATALRPVIPTIPATICDGGAK